MIQQLVYIQKKILKPTAFEYTSDNQPEKYHGKTMLFVIAIKTMQYLEINLIRNLQDPLKQVGKIFIRNLKTNSSFDRWRKYTVI